MDIGRKILNLRKDQGVAQNSLAGMTSVTPSALSRIESGHHQPRGPVALRIARELGVTVDYLLDPTAPYPPPAREILANIRRSDEGMPRDLTLKVTRREKRILEELRQMEEEQVVLLESALWAPRDHSRYATFLLGAADSLPGIDEAELQEFKERLG